VKDCGEETEPQSLKARVRRTGHSCRKETRCKVLEIERKKGIYSKAETHEKKSSSSSWSQRRLRAWAVRRASIRRLQVQNISQNQGGRHHIWKGQTDLPGNLRNVWEQKWEQDKKSIYIGGGPCSVWGRRVNQLNKYIKDNENQVTHCCRIYREGKLEWTLDDRQ
jgi:hypothetical protein